ncbi:MAG: hypothetical protein M1484_01930 [Patescibacteria group bacterium]|nr:hypothetical protein [Patescibacteria group bacterium]
MIYDSILSRFPKTGQILNLSEPTNYNIRFDGAVIGDNLGANEIVADIDNDGQPDLVMAAPIAGNNGRAKSGSVYVIYNSLLKQFAGTGNNVDLFNTANFNIRIDGDIVTKSVGIGYGAMCIADINNDGTKDLLIPSLSSNENGRTDSGVVFIIDSRLLSNYTGTGNIDDLANSTHYTLRIDGATAYDEFGVGDYAGDIDNNGKTDLIIGADDASYNSRSRNGHSFGQLTG